MNYLMFEGKRYLLVEEKQNAEEACNVKAMTELSTIPAGDTCRIDGEEYIILKHTAEGTELLMRECLPDKVTFGDNNNYNGSKVDEACIEFSEYLVDILGSENIIEHTVDLTANDGLKEYGNVIRRASVLTAERAREYVDILDKYKLDDWWWLATPWSTPAHEDNEWVLCVSPRGNIDGKYYYGNSGVRPFCVLKSNILVSK